MTLKDYQKWIAVIFTGLLTLVLHVAFTGFLDDFHAMQSQIKVLPLMEYRLGQMEGQLREMRQYWEHRTGVIRPLEEAHHDR